MIFSVAERSKKVPMKILRYPEDIDLEPDKSWTHPGPRPIERYSSIQWPPDRDREFCNIMGGTFLSKKTPFGIKPGVPFEEVVKKPAAPYLIESKPGREPRIIIPSKGSDLYFGPPVDSTLLNYEDAAKAATIFLRAILSGKVDRILNGMGSDTAAYMSAAMALMLRNPSLPIINMYGMITPGEKNTDVYTKLQMARTAGRFLDPGVFCMSQKGFIDARRATKFHSGVRADGSTEKNAFCALGAEETACWEMGEGLTFNYWPQARLLQHYEDLKTYQKRWEYQQRRKQEGKSCPIDMECRFWHMTKGDVESAIRMETGSESFLKWKANGIVPTEYEILNPKTPTLNTEFDNLVANEHFTPGYKPEWLESMLQRDDVHGLILEGFDFLSPEQIGAVTRILKKYSDKKPIVLMENPSAPDTPYVNTAMRNIAAQSSVILSEGCSFEYGSFALMQLLAETRDVSTIQSEWKNIEDIGGIGYVSTRDQNSFLERFEASQFTEPGKNIRYIKIRPGYEPAWLESILRDPSVDAVIIGGFGPGHIPFQGKYELASSIRRHSSHTPVFIRRQGEEGENDSTIYEIGKETLKAGCIQAAQGSLYESFMITATRLYL